MLKLLPPDNGDAVVINAFSMGVLHRAVPTMVRLCLVPACVPRTLAWEAVGGWRDTSELLRIKHPSGEVGAELGRNRGDECARHADRVEADGRLGLVTAFTPCRCCI